MNTLTLYAASIDLVVRHPDCEQKPGIIEEIREDLHHKHTIGELSLEQRDSLLALLNPVDSRLRV